MPFGLKNAGLTFQRTMHITLKDLPDHNIEAYVGNIMVKTRQQETLLWVLSKGFASL
jgi:hypothetical protein